MKTVYVLYPYKDEIIPIMKALSDRGVKVVLESLNTLLSGPAWDKNVLVWGWHKGRRLHGYGYNVLVAERSYIGNRFKYISLGFNGLNGHAEFPEYPDDGGARFRQIGGVIYGRACGNKDVGLILGQVRGDASLQTKDITPWYKRQAHIIRTAGYKPVFRPHPEAERRGGYLEIEGVETSIGKTLDEDIATAAFTVAYNSNSCLDSILLGVPCIAGDKGTMAYDLCFETPEAIWYPDIKQVENVVHKIAWTQWTKEEIEAGLPMDKIIEKLR